MREQGNVVSFERPASYWAAKARRHYTPDRLPEAARLWGDFDDVSQSRLTRLLETELGIPRSAQTYYLT